MASLISFTLEGLRMLSFLAVLGVGIAGTLTLTGCDQPASDPTPTTPDPDPAAPADTPEEPVEDIKIDAPGVNIDIDRTPDADGGRDVDVDVDREPLGEREIDVNVDPN